MASNNEGRTEKAGLADRGYSDSEVPTNRRSPDKELHQFVYAISDNTGEASSRIHTEPPGLQSPEAVPLSSRMKARHNLQLPSFKSLGIAVPHPSALLTPPEDDGRALADPPALGPTSTPTQVYPTASVPQESVPDKPEIICSSTPTNKLASSANVSASGAPAISGSQEQEIVPPEVIGASGSTSGSSSAAPERPSWMADAFDVVVSSVDTSRNSNVVNMLTQTQPCPPSNEDREEPATSVFNDLVVEVQKITNNSGKYIEISHAVPSKFNMTQIPASPMATPITGSANNEAADYFSVVFSRAVVARDHNSALSSPMPSSPHPVVPPSSVVISLLERYIPPTSTMEAVDTFSTEGPSVLMDRLVELSSGGSLVFVYPTRQGAQTFASRYLAPILGPILRTMIGVYGLATDIGTNLGEMASIDVMLPLEQMVRRINLILKKLNRGTSVRSHLTTTAPKFTLLQSSKQVVQIDHEDWLHWWTYQESDRIRQYFSRYFSRGYRLPHQEHISAGYLHREIIDGVQNRWYSEYDSPREGVEVGVFVIKRTA